MNWTWFYTSSSLFNTRMYIFGPSTEWMLESNRIVIFLHRDQLCSGKELSNVQTTISSSFFFFIFSSKNPTFSPPNPEYSSKPALWMTFCALFLCKTLYSRLIHCEMLQAAFSQFLCVFNFIWRRRNNSHSVFNDRKNEFSQKNAQIHLRFSLSCTICELIKTNRDRHKHTQIPQSIDLFPPTNEHFLSYERKLQKMKSHWAYLFSLSLVCNEQRNH